MSERSEPPVEIQGLERLVMDEIWRRGEATVALVADAINDASGRRRAYTTFLTVMRRLDEKGLLRRERRGKTDHYTPALTLDAYLEARTGADIEAIMSAYGDRALVHFARQIGTLDGERRKQLERLADGD